MQIAFHKVKAHLENTKLKCLATFGFCASPEHTLQKNFKNALTTPLKPLQYQQPKNLTFHNLCKKNILPPGSRVLLGLNLKFCLANKTITNNINKTMLCLARSLCTSYYLKENGIVDDSANEKQVYI